jgi:hypothetical protein
MQVRFRRMNVNIRPKAKVGMIVFGALFAIAAIVALAT